MARRGAGVAVRCMGMVPVLVSVPSGGASVARLRGHRLLDAETTQEKAQQIGRHFLVGPTGYAVATLLALMLPSAALVVFLLLNVFYLWPRKRVPA